VAASIHDPDDRRLDTGAPDPPDAFDGAVDADAHILEPPTLWEEYIDPQYRDRALRIAVDENGLEELVVGGAVRRCRAEASPRPSVRWGHPT
jgi:hypothetical protein